jgi:diketogulonate reductase-like aldo/keto reductase
VLYQSFWTLSANPQILAHSILRALALAHQRTPPQILFRYLTQAGVVPLTGTRSEAHMREDLSIFDFELSAAERREVDGLFAHIRG